MTDTLSIKEAYEKLETLCITFEENTSDLKEDLKINITDILVALPGSTPAEDLKAMEKLAKLAAKGKFTEAKSGAKTMLDLIEVIETPSTTEDVDG